MKKYLILFLLACSTSTSFSQIHEIGFFVGGANYIGDVGSQQYINPNDIGIGIVYKHNLNPRIALRGTFTYMGITGDDAKSKNSFRKERGFSFGNRIHELAAGIEFNFFDYNTRQPNTSFTPYILAEIAAFNYNSISNNFSSEEEIAYDINYSYTAPVGVGIKGRLADNLAYAFESGVRFTFVDNIDSTTSDIERLDFAGNGYDHYLFSAFSLVYTFGRPPCYAERE